jgi:HEPN domain-containing protein
MAYDRTLLQQLAMLRLEEAKLLAREGQFSGAYYLAGYAIECALKVLIASQFRENEIPDRILVDKVYTHKLADLLKLAGLENTLEMDRQRDPNLERRWSAIKNWSEQARYAIWTEEQARAIIDAIDGDGRSGGLFQWLSARW